MRGVKITLHKDRVYLEKTCTVTKEDYCVDIPLSGYMLWRGNRELIQNVFPKLTPDDREFLISGWTPAEWNKKIGDGKAV